ncbi:MAG TPA: hypothetical protein VGC87_04560 [Pyrinomonadaceae bacterium]
MHETGRRHSFRLGVFAALAVALVSLYPQLRLVTQRGANWNGSYAIFSQDEVAYSAYVNALAAGRPRRNDPYTGRDDSVETPQHESLFSIQFVTPYLLALPARALGLSAPTTFILLTAAVAFFSTLALFWLIRLVTGDENWAAAGALVVVCLGTFAILYAPLRSLAGLDTTYTFEYFPFLRRYVPALPFPFFFVFCALVWRAVTSTEKRASLAAGLLAGATFGLLVFSYFYLWTAAAAWVMCFALLLLVARRESLWKTLAPFGPVALVALAALVPYALLLSRRAPTMDTVQLMAFTHAPDFSRSSIKLGLLVCLALALAAWRGRVEWRDRPALLAASFALTPLVVFNQQVLTGRSLQPLHYELYLAKYLALTALVLAVALIRCGRAGARRPFPARALACVAAVALGWGMFETAVETKRHAWASNDRDEALPVARRLAQFAREEPASNDGQAVVLYSNLDHADFSPVVAPQPVLWSPHVPAFSGVTLEENRERLYQYLYYVNEDFGGAEENFDALDYRKKFLIRSLIEWGHNDPAWTVDWKPLTREDVRAALDGYRAYAAAFTREQAARPALSHLVVATDAPPDLSNLDRWYERDAGERVGPFTIYRLKLRP